MAEEKSKLEQFAEMMRKQIGQVYTYQDFDYANPDYRQEYYNTEVSLDSIKHFLDGIGDINPLYRDRKYAARSRYGRLIAPPSFLETINYSQHAKGIPPGVEGFLSGFEWEYYRPACEGDKCTARVIYPSDVQVKPSRFAGQMVILYEKGYMVRQGDDVIAKYRSWVIHMEKRKDAPQKDIHPEMPEYTKEYIEKVYAAQDNEIPRADNPRYWEDVNEGDEMAPVVRGPYSASEKFAWFVGKGNPPSCVSDRLFRMIAAKHGDPLGSYDEGLKVFVRPSMFNIKSQADRGVPRMHDAGAQRNAWRNLVLTNWIGNEGFIWKSGAEVRGFNQEGDITWCKGQVTKKYVTEGRHCVDIKSWCENQRGEVTMPGTATIILPSKDKGPVKFPEPNID
jgi:hypothetical protein